MGMSPLATGTLAESAHRTSPDPGGIESDYNTPYHTSINTHTYTIIISYCT